MFRDKINEMKYGLKPNKTSQKEIRNRDRRKGCYRLVARGIFRSDCQDVAWNHFNLGTPQLRTSDELFNDVKAYQPDYYPIFLNRKPEGFAFQIYANFNIGEKQ